MTDFFISYTGADRAWAEWIAWILEETGASTFIQAWDFRPGSNFVAEMQTASSNSERTIAVLSPDYLNSPFAMSEWAAAFAADPDGTKRKLVPVLVRDTALEGLLVPHVYINLVGLGESAARERLITGLAPGRAKPTSVPFPGAHLFPGSATTPADPITAQAALAVLPLDEVPKPGPLPVGSRMPLPSNPLFVGREEYLKTLARQLKAGETSAVGQVEIAAATGLGGIGKTQLASEFVHCYGRFFAGGVFWMSFADGGAVPAEVAACGRSLGLHSSFEALTLEQQVRLVGEAWQNPLPRLLVFDNCEEEELLRRWRPRFGGARVLVTSRRPEWEPTLGVRTVPITTLPRPASIELLRRFRPDISEAEAALDEIAGDLGDLPLALHLAGSFLKTYRASAFGQPEAYLLTLRQRDLLDHPSLQGRGSGTLPTGHEAHVGRTFAISFERLDPSSATDILAKAILARAAWFSPGEPIPRYLLLETVHAVPSDLETDLLAEDALRRLTDLGLMEGNDRNDLLMHRLVAAWTRSMEKGEEARKTVEEGVLKEARRLNETLNPALLQIWQPHLRTVTDHAVAGERRTAARLCDELGLHLWQAGAYSEAKPYLERAVALHAVHSGAEHPDTASSLNSLARLLHSQGDYLAALSYYGRAFALRERVLGPDHPDTAQTLSDLGVLLHDQGKHVEAYPYCERALAIREKKLGTEHPDTALSFNNLASLLQEQKRYEEARQCFEQAVMIYERMQPPENPEIARPLSNIGTLLQEQEDYEGALLYSERALAIRERHLGPEHPATATVLSNLGSIFQSMGAKKKALDCYKRALSIRETALGKDHPDTAVTLMNLGSF